jgi:solute carrier family 25 (mitochondrial phosphate transporter), member 3
MSTTLTPPKPDVLKRSLPFGKIEPNTPKYFATCMLGGVIACGPTHTFVTPLDLVKTRRQVDPKLYRGNFQAWRSIFAKEGVRGVFFGWAPTFVGYSFQGLGKYGFYEVFKHEYGDNLLPHMNRTLVFLAASASAEFIADIFLCPFEAVKVRMQTTLPPYASTLREGWRKIVAKEGYAGLYKGIVPLWGRQIPYTMCKFATFEETVSAIYRQLGQPKDSYGKLAQTGVSFLGGYIAGVACAVISHPADVMVSKLNADRQRKSDVSRAWRWTLLTTGRDDSRRERSQGHGPHLRQHWLHRAVERLAGPDRHDRHADCLPVAHVRFCSSSSRSVVY